MAIMSRDQDNTTFINEAQYTTITPTNHIWRQILNAASTLILNLTFFVQHCRIKEKRGANKEISKKVRILKCVETIMEDLKQQFQK